MYVPIADTRWKNDESVRILCVEGFCSEDGNTRFLLDRFLSEYKNASVIEYNTYKEEPKPCRGCDKCADTGKCVFRDLDDFFGLFITADIIVFASPVYNMSFPAPLKALIDRFQPYYNGYYKNKRVQQIKKRRSAYLLVTSGRGGKESFDIMEKQLKRAFSVLNIEYKKGVLAENTDKRFLSEDKGNGKDNSAQRRQ